MKATEINDKILSRAESIQKEMHQMINILRKHDSYKNYDYKDIKDVFFFIKIAQLEQQIAEEYKLKIKEL